MLPASSPIVAMGADPALLSLISASTSETYLPLAPVTLIAPPTAMFGSGPEQPVPAWFDSETESSAEVTMLTSRVCTRTLATSFSVPLGWLNRHRLALVLGKFTPAPIVGGAPVHVPVASRTVPAG